MLTRLEKAQQKWGGSHSVIDKWLTERQELLVLFCRIAGFSPYEKKDHALPDQLQIQNFCQILMDYLSAGHFEIYDDIAKACEEKGPESQKLASALYPRISETTDIALDFNDKYAEVDKDDLLDEFDKDLSALGEALELRFELEDELIDNLYSNHTS
ncbi:MULTISPECIES: Rsd/AlgQ family anti-sigma factor [Pseudoalteromonas]|jgi:regulator of sigma D|uniref:Rsd/AlgQ family anti-sigma factor n=1 Tax=Pseudoalteromonas TaxID=53246 RepID=UPI000785DD91|nr:MULTISPECIES: Rsd/AlgQ family anti-sigma factor [Gammaproteobacteria]MCF7501976.1 Rsd/AlgQ family anti-sigma factor [Pseudoalteromonas sp. L1]RZF95197.1 Rsd/AlgQ family anti-sigma factor [Pseudoalteromonas sp. CO302Y]RZG11695.1 Rsd/AlgQ family anti-sigma factor [Pseudoalteromonas sp. CO133X]UJX25415.1 Rsd/AlgQ family anti-sigma factor [Pseudoalteromonas sp. CF6-2]WOC26115.1 Rsd/AlgQ family anti-sigma factor [Pseudoalteromonas sp. N1230-9]|tara:strand:+ start:3141 stop:3611 length:471 start_codon:yes stop_codon:yes gene_type:complete